MTESEQPASVAERDSGLLYYPPVVTHLVRSKYVAQTFQVQVMQPACRRGERSRFPVVYATDANRTFDMFKGISQLMQSPERDESRFILVGIGYPSQCPAAGLVLRARDFTFPGYPQHSLQPPPVDGVLAVQEGTKSFYGADDFQRFIEHELMPLIDRKYPTLVDERTYFGHSAGGGFGLFTLFSKPQLFTNYIVSSPGLIYHGETTSGVCYEEHDFLLQTARKFIASGESLRGVRLYMSVGSEEEFESVVARWRLTSSFYRMAGLLKAADVPGLELMTEVFSGETHMTAWPMAYIHGVNAVFRHRRSDRVTHNRVDGWNQPARFEQEAQPAVTRTIR